MLQKEPAQRHAAPLAARQLRHIGIVRRAAQRIHRQIDLGVEIPQPLGLDLVLKLGHFVGGFVGIVRGQLVVAVENRPLGRHALHDVLPHRFSGIELRFLLQIADTGAFGRPGFAGILGVEPRHDAQQRRLAGAVDAEHADLGVRVKSQTDVIQNLAVARIGLGQILHVIDELTGHAASGYCPALFLRQCMGSWR